MIKKLLSYRIFLSFLFSLTILSTYASVKKPRPLPNTIEGIEELIIQVPLSGDKTNDLIEQSLIAFSGLKLIGKCNDQKLFFITIDRSLLQGNEFLEQTFRSLSLDYDIKIGTSIQTAMNNCKISNDNAAPEEADVE